MAFDAMFLKAMTEELAEHGESGRIMKIHQPFSHELVLYIRKTVKINVYLSPRIQAMRGFSGPMIFPKIQQPHRCFVCYCENT